MTDHLVASRDEWEAARAGLLQREKEHTRLGDELARERRELPWLRVETDYRFDTSEGTKSLAELFDGRSQLLIYHFMFGPDYEAGCPTCSSMADGMDGSLPHLHARDTTFLFVSHAPIDKLLAYRQRMGWNIPWASDGISGFNSDHGFSSTEEQTRQWAEPMLESGTPPTIERNARTSGTDPIGYLTQQPGFTAFVLDEGVVHQTYSATGRGVEFLMGYYPILDRTYKGRDEGAGAQLWIQRHDEYNTAASR